MTLRTTTRTCAVLGAFLLLLGAIVALTTQDADAATQDKIVLGEGEVFEKEYGPILPANALANVSGPTAINTDICAAAPYCDVIPLEIHPPRTFTEETADYFVHVELSWPSVVVDAPANGETSATDLDLFIVNDPFNEEAGPDQDGFAYRAATQRNPEAFTMYAPAGKWNLLIDNYASAPTNYTIKIEWRTSTLPTPFESLPPEFSQTGSLGATPAKPSLVDPPRPASANPSPVFTPAPVAAGAPNLAPATPPTADSSFSTGFDDGAGLDEQLTAPPASFDLQPVARETPADPPSGLALLLWLIGLPLLLTAVGGWYLQRRQAAAIQF